MRDCEFFIEFNVKYITYIFFIHLQIKADFLYQPPHVNLKIRSGNYLTTKFS